ncbi:methionine ABC transporter ATP-binding protein, partial [Streptomyces sp. MCAF7]
PKAQDICRTDVPVLEPVTEQDGTPLPGRGSACHFWKETIHG